MRTALRVLLIITIFFLLLIFSSLSLLYLKRNEITSVFLQTIQNNVTTKVTVERVNVSLFQRFPNASVKIRNICFYNPVAFDIRPFAGVRGDTLCFVNNLFLEFNLLDILNHKYTLRRIYASGGQIILLTGNDGKCNYRIFKHEKKAAAGNASSIRLSNVRISNMEYLVISRYNNYYLNGKTSGLLFKGDFSPTQQLLTVTGNTYIRRIAAGNTVYIEEQPTALHSVCFITGDFIRLTDTDLRIAGQKFAVSGSLLLGTKQAINLKVNGHALDIRRLLKILPAPIRNVFNDYNCSGKIYLTSEIKGRFSGTNYPRVNLRFQISGAKAKHRKTSISAQDINATGYFTFGENQNASGSMIKISAFHSSIGQGIIDGDFELHDLNNPRLSGNIKCTADAGDLMGFFKADSLIKLSGPLTLRSNFNLLLKKISDHQSFHYDDFAGQVQISCQGLQCLWPDRNMTYKNITGELFLNTHSLFTDSLSFELNQNTFLIKGEIKGLVPWLTKKNTVLQIRSTVYSPDLNLEKAALVFNEPAGNKSNTVDPVLNLRFNFDRLTYQNFSAQNVQGTLFYAHQRLYIDPCSFRALDGHINTTLMMVRYDNGQSFLRHQFILDQINVSDLFSSFNNFGQTVILDKNLSGKLTGKAIVSYELDTANKMITDSLLAQSDLTITNGRLINYEPMTGLSKFAEISELKDIRFQTLRNTIFIKNRTIIIPEMDIHSSVMNISGSGEHHFDNSYIYHIRVLMSDILWARTRRAKKENDAFGIRDNNETGTSLYLTIRGKGKDYKVSYDTKKVLELITGRMKKEKNELRTILDQEFGTGTRDSLKYKYRNNAFQPEREDTGSAVKDKSRNFSTEKYRIEWDDE